MKKQVVVIGVGRFGGNIAREVYQMGHDVLAIDTDENKIQAMLGQVTYAVKADATNETVLRELGVPNFDVGVVAIGSNIQTSIIVTVLLKSLGIPFIIARAINNLHGNTLERIGAEKVVYPEREMGSKVAHMLFSPGVLDYMEVSPDFRIVKIKPPDHMLRQSLEQAGLGGPRDKYHVTVLLIKRGRDHILIPAPDEVLRPGDLLVVAGKGEQLARLQTAARERGPETQLEPAQTRTSSNGSQ